MLSDLRTAFSEGWYSQAARQNSFIPFGNLSVKWVGAALISAGLLLPAVEVKAQVLDLDELPTMKEVLDATRKSTLGVDPHAQGHFKLQPGSPCKYIDGGSEEHINKPYAEGGHGGDAFLHLDCNGNGVSDGQDMIHGFQPAAEPSTEFDL